MKTSATVQVVVVWQYEENNDGSFSLQAEKCLQLREDCECTKQHREVFTKLRGSESHSDSDLTTPLPRVRRSKRSKQPTDTTEGSLRYLMSPGVKQNIMNNKDPKGGMWA